MSRVIMITAGFAPYRVLERCFRQVYSTIGISVEHYFINNHYPINKEENDKLVIDLCKQYNVTYLDKGKNIGLSASLNYLIEQSGAKEGDFIIGLDSDVYPVTMGWGQALLDVAKDSRIGWASLTNPATIRETNERGFTPAKIGGQVVRITHEACLNSICCWPMSTILKLKKIEEPNEFYGGLEAANFGRLRAEGQHWAFLRDFEEHRCPPEMEQDACYKEYKWAYAHEHSTTLDFEGWLKEDPSRLKL